MNQTTQKTTKSSSPWLTTTIVFGLILIFFILRTFIYDMYRIPSMAMLPTLWSGDFIIVDKRAYGWRNPLSSARWVGAGKPQRGDVIVFRYPENPSIQFVKRVVAIPGDKVFYDHENKILSINDKVLPQKSQGTFMGQGAHASMTGASIYDELQDGRTHPILVFPNSGNMPPEHPEYYKLTLGEDEYFVMGDNRDNSRDSRYWGTLSEGQLVGKVRWVLFNFNVGGRFFMTVD